MAVARERVGCVAYASRYRKDTASQSDSVLAGSERENMAKLTARPLMELQVAFAVSEIEARALDALVGYGDDEFIEVFYTKLGKAYMEEHEAGLRSFFKSIREMMPGYLKLADDAKAVFSGEKKAEWRHAPEQKKATD